MKYTNPIILQDFSDPDVIRVGDDFYMVASSFNYVPGVPVLHSKNLVEWEIINYVLLSLPYERYDAVCHGCGAWAPSLRYHNGKFYCMIPFPDEGIHVSETEDIYGDWSPLRPLLIGKGYEDPCPIWRDGKCYVVFAFVKSRIGFNSKLAVFETDEGLTQVANSYKIIYDGTDEAPGIEGPKFYEHGKYIYILAPAGGVATGWQVALRSERIYGDYKLKIIQVQGGTDVNGPHQGGLVSIDDSGDKWAFIHFQDMGPYGRVVHLQPAVWKDDWVYCGQKDFSDKAPGVPVSGGDYPVDIKTDATLFPDDEFDGPVSPVWQTPANRKDGWFALKHGLRLNCVLYEKAALSDVPQILSQKVCYKNFKIKTKCKLNLKEDGDETGLVMFGREYAYVCAVRRGGKNFLEIRSGRIGGESDETLAKSIVYDGDAVTFQISAKYEERHKLVYRFKLGDVAFSHKFYATGGVWTGARVGLYARSLAESKGYSTYKFFRVTCTDNRYEKD